MYGFQKKNFPMEGENLANPTVSPLCWCQLAHKTQMPPSDTASIQPEEKAVSGSGAHDQPTPPESAARRHQFLFLGVSSGVAGVRALSLIFCQRPFQSRQLEAHASPGALARRTGAPNHGCFCLQYASGVI